VSPQGEANKEIAQHLFLFRDEKEKGKRKRRGKAPSAASICAIKSIEGERR